jgi:hypothetical protein
VALKAELGNGLALTGASWLVGHDLPAASTWWTSPAGMIRPSPRSPSRVLFRLRPCQWQPSGPSKSDLRSNPQFRVRSPRPRNRFHRVPRQSSARPQRGDVIDCTPELRQAGLAICEHATGPLFTPLSEQNLRSLPAWGGAAGPGPPGPRHGWLCVLGDDPPPCALQPNPEIFIRFAGRLILARGAFSHHFYGRMTAIGDDRGHL